MCGIVGWLGQKIDKNAAAQALNALHHRGPDGQGQWEKDSVWLGHKRLSILDLSVEGHQPMVSHGGRYAVTYNGEVYNYKELRKKLETNGVRFRGHSDTEVLLAACETWGIEKAVSRFEGMFAFALYDIAEKTLWLARDPLGIKPLFYAFRNGEFAFASELSALSLIPWVDQSLDSDALHAYFRYLCVPAPASIFKNVHKLVAGSLLRWDGKQALLKPYWVAEEKARESRKNLLTIDFKDAADELEALLKRSVRLHMQSDVPYGAFLSGGIDSSTVVALMQAESTRPVKTFSIGFNESTHDESGYAKAVAQHLGTEHHELILSSEQIISLVPKVNRFYDEPFADGSSVPTFLVSEFAREYVTVSLSGDGGDELFAGYPRYFWANRIERLRALLSRNGSRYISTLLQQVPDGFYDQFLHGITRGKLSGSEGLSARVKRFAQYLGCPRNQVYAQTMSAWQNPEALLIDNTYSRLLGADDAAYPDLSWEEEMMLIDQSNYLQDDILVKLDRASMAVSLEARVPLLIHPLVEWAWRVPLRFKMPDSGDSGKLLLREVLYRYVPRQLIERPKQGFGMPMSKWLRGPLRDWAESYLSSKDLENAGLNTKLVQKVWREHLEGKNHLPKIWTVLMYRQWQETWKKQAEKCAA